jgi:hypothetical protein
MTLLPQLYLLTVLSKHSWVNILTISNIKVNTSRNLTRFQTIPSLERLLLLQDFLINQNLSSTTNPLSIAAIASVSAKAKIHAIAHQIHIWELAIPLSAPVGAVLVTREECEEAFGLEESRHEWDVAADVDAIDGALMVEWDVVGDAWELVLVDAGNLHLALGVDWVVHERDGWGDGLLLLDESSIGLEEPVGDLCRVSENTLLGISNYEDNEGLLAP